MNLEAGTHGRCRRPSPNQTDNPRLKDETAESPEGDRLNLVGLFKLVHFLSAAEPGLIGRWNVRTRLRWAIRPLSDFAIIRANPDGVSPRETVKTTFSFTGK
jgi:hypothetical protein